MKGIIWEETSGTEVAEFNKKSDIAILAAGCIEMHGPHVPAGTDYIIADGLARMLVEREAVLMMPTMAININGQMKCYPGTISISPTLWIQLYEALCDEAARNGFRKIAILPNHGGNNYVVNAFLSQLFENNRLEYKPKKNYQVFVLSWGLSMHSYFDTTDLGGGIDGHGGAVETSMVMAFKPELVHLDKLEPLPEGVGPYYGVGGGQLGFIENANYRLDWTKQVPKGYCGYPQKATKELGVKVVTDIVNNYAETIRKIREFEFSP